MPTSDPPALQVPQDTSQRFPELVALILGSESMNDEERQYWINVLPSMSPEQQENLRQILQNEKDQLAAINVRYEKEVEGVGSVRAVEEIGAERKKKKIERMTVEDDLEKNEKEQEENILKEIEEMGTT